MDIIRKARERLTQARAEVVRLEAFLKTAEDLEEEFGGEPDARVVSAKPRQMAQRGTGAATVRMAVEVIKQHGRLPTRELVPLIEARGIEIGGKSKVATLSARLSGGKDVLEMVEGKWGLVNSTLGASGASALQENEATDESVEERSAAPLFNQAEKGGTYHAAALA